MKKINYITTLIFLFANIVGLSAQNNLSSNVKFATMAKAVVLLSKEDAYTNGWSKFDIESRMQKKNSTKAELIHFACSQVLRWNENEEKRIMQTINKIDSIAKVNNYKIDFPKDIYFIKSTLKDEAGAEGYTRENYIVLRENVMQMPDNEFEHMIIHELFHLLTRKNIAFKRELYKIIGFNIITDLPYPSQIKDFKISNPDTPHNDSYITVNVDGKATDCMMILCSQKEYTTGTFFNYINVGFLKLDGMIVKQPSIVDGKPVIYSFEDITNFSEQVGTNTGYVINPEEILADNFAFAISDKKGLPSQWVVTKIQEALRK